MAVYKRKDTKSRGWFYKFTINGVTYKKAIPTARTRRQADEAERQAREDVHNGTYSIQPDILFKEFVEKHYVPYADKHLKKADMLGYSLKYLNEFFGSYTLRQISPFLIEKFKLELFKTEKRTGGQRKASSVNAILMLLSGVLTRAVTEGYLRENHARKVKHLPVEETKPRTLLDWEETLLINACESGPGFLKPMVQLALWLGWRKSEILHLRKSNVDFSRNLVFVPDAKWSRDPRKTKGIPMSKKVRELLSELIDNLATEYLFTSPRTGKPYAKITVHLAFKKACDSAGITDLRFHDLRHTFGTRLAEANVGVEKIRRAMGHSSIATTMIYVHTSQETLQDVMDQAAKDAKSSTVIVPLKKREVG